MPWGVRLTLYISLAGLFFQWYVARRTAGALTQINSSWPRRRIKLAVGSLVFLPVLYPLTLLGAFFLGRSSTVVSSNIVVDSLLTYPFWMGLVIVVQLGVLFAGMDIVRLIARAIRKGPPHRPLYQAWFIIGISLLMSVYVVAKVLNDTLSLRTTSTEFRVPDLPADLDGLKIVQIGDIQVDARTNGRKLENYIETVNSLEPDLILYCGDLVTSGTGYIEQAASAVGRMKSRLGVYGALGDHDFFSNRELVLNGLRNNGATILEDESIALPAGASSIVITGVTNVYRRRTAEAAIESNERRRPRGELNLFVTHQPSERLVAFAAAHGYDIFLGGHTHGGQVVFPLPGYPLSGSRVETKYVTGFHRVGSMLVSTTNGLGLTLAPIRYHAPAEVTLIVVRRSH